MLIDEVANISAIIVSPSPFCSYDCLTEVKFLLLFFNDRAISWACAGKIMAFSLYGSFFKNIYIL